MLYSLTAAVLLVLPILAVLLALSYVRSYAQLRHIKGPFWAGWTDVWLIQGQLSGRLNFILAEAINKHGK
jgi:hypothetical protein